MNMRNRSSFITDPRLSTVRINGGQDRAQVMDVFMLPPDALNQRGLVVHTPVDITEMIVESVKNSSGAHADVHPYLLRCGIYALTDDWGYILYLGQTSSGFGIYLKNKLGIKGKYKRNVSGSVVKCTAYYWTETVHLLDIGNDRVIDALTSLISGRFRVYLLPVELRGIDTKGSEKRMIRALEYMLLSRCEELAGYRPSLNYTGSNSLVGNSVARKQRTPNKIRRMLRRKRGLVFSNVGKD